MGLDSVVESIIAQAKGEAANIESEANKQAREIAKKAEQGASEQAQKKRAETELLIKETQRMELSSLKLQLNKGLLNAKKEIIDSVYGGAIKQIQSMDKEGRKKLIKKLGSDAMEELPNATRFYSNEIDRGIIRELFPKLSFKGNADVLGGIILENNEGTVRVNKTFEIFLEKTKEANLNEISERLFR